MTQTEKNKKICFICKGSFLHSFFNKNSKSSDGLKNECKACRKKLRHQSYLKIKDEVIKQSKNYRNKNKKYLKKKAHENYLKNKDIKIKKQLEWYANNKERVFAKRKELVQKYMLKDSTKNKLYARKAVYKAIKSGELIRKPCQECGKVEVHAHHYKGYSRVNWLKVQWLCTKHHGKTYSKF